MLINQDKNYFLVWKKVFPNKNNTNKDFKKIFNNKKIKINNK